MEQTEDGALHIEKCDGKVQWDEFILEHAGHPMQLWGWGDARASLGWQVDRIFIVEADVQIGAVQILMKKLPGPFGLSLYVPRGPVIVKNETAIYEQLIAYVKDTYHGTALIVEPNSEHEPAGTGWKESDVHALAPLTILFDLSKADGVLLAEMDQPTRDHIRTANQANLTIKKLGNPEDIADCYALYCESISRSDNKPYKEKYFQELQDKLGDFSAIFGAYDGEELVSFIWIATSESIAIELYGGSSKRGFELDADYGLRWETIRRIKQWGVAAYDIGGVDPNNTGDVKHGFSNQYTDRGTFALPLSPLYRIWARANRSRAHYAK